MRDPWPAIAAAAAIVIMLFLIHLIEGAAKGFSVAETLRIGWHANRRFWRGQRDWSGHGDQDRHESIPRSRTGER